MALAGAWLGHASECKISSSVCRFHLASGAELRSSLLPQNNAQGAGFYITAPVCLPQLTVPKIKTWEIGQGVVEASRYGRRPGACNLDCAPGIHRSQADLSPLSLSQGTLPEGDHSLHAEVVEH